MIMKYKEYLAEISLDEEAGIFHGEISNIRDVVTFQGNSVEELQKEFALSVEDYLAFCKNRGETPDRVFSGKLLLRMTPQEHKEFFTEAQKTHKSLNAWILDSLKTHQ